MSTKIEKIKLFVIKKGCPCEHPYEQNDKLLNYRGVPVGNLPLNSFQQTL